MTALVRRDLPRLAPAVNWSRWVLRCPRCPSALQVDPGGTQVFSCTSCDATAEIVWPPDEMIHGIERLLLMRPDESTRNWEPGETLVDLMVQNGAHGIFDPVDGALTVSDSAILRDSLPLTRRRVLQLKGA